MKANQNNESFKEKTLMPCTQPMTGQVFMRLLCDWHDAKYQLTELSD